jgi:uncharacterized protein (TIGR04255 family)
MATYNGILSKAPAREALIDLQFAPAVPNDAVRNFAEEAKARYERSNPIWQAVFGFSVNPDGSAQTPDPEKTAIGYRLEADSPSRVLQCRLNGFTFSRLFPYGNWEELRDATKTEWDRFISFAPNLSIHRIAVRYINELKIPLPIRDFGEFLTSPPDIPPSLPQAVSAFLQRVVIPDSEKKCTSIVTQVLEEPNQQEMNHVTVILDIDVFRTVQIQANDSEQIWKALDELRIQKNRMFFGHITDKMVELIK